MSVSEAKPEGESAGFTYLNVAHGEGLKRTSVPSAAFMVYGGRAGVYRKEV